jgi:hypothetical protein
VLVESPAGVVRITPEQRRRALPTLDELLYYHRFSVAAVSVDHAGVSLAYLAYVGLGRRFGFSCREYVFVPADVQSVTANYAADRKPRR